MEIMEEKPMEQHFTTIAASCALGATLTILFFVQYAVKLAIFTKNRVESEIAQAQATMKQASELNQLLVSKIEVLEDQHRALEFFKSHKE